MHNGCVERVCLCIYNSHAPNSRRGGEGDIVWLISYKALLCTRQAREKGARLPARISYKYLPGTWQQLRGNHSILQIQNKNNTMMLCVFGAR